MICSLLPSNTWLSTATILLMTSWCEVSALIVKLDDGMIAGELCVTFLFSPVVTN